MLVLLLIKLLSQQDNLVVAIQRHLPLAILALMLLCKDEVFFEAADVTVALTGQLNVVLDHFADFLHNGGTPLCNFLLHVLATKALCATLPVCFRQLPLHKVSLLPEVRVFGSRAVKQVSVSSHLVLHVWHVYFP
jgi:hypothetical protein